MSRRTPVGLLMLLTVATSFAQTTPAQKLLGKWNCRERYDRSPAIVVAPDLWIDFRPAGRVSFQSRGGDVLDSTYGPDGDRLGGPFIETFHFEGDRLILINTTPQGGFNCERAAEQSNMSGRDVLLNIFRARLSCDNATCSCGGTNVVDNSNGSLYGYKQFRDVSGAPVRNNVSPVDAANGVQEEWSLTLMSSMTREYSNYAHKWQEWNTFFTGPILTVSAVKKHGAWQIIETDSTLGLRPPISFTHKATACSNMPN